METCLGKLNVEAESLTKRGNVGGLWGLMRSQLAKASVANSPTCLLPLSLFVCPPVWLSPHWDVPEIVMRASVFTELGRIDWIIDQCARRKEKRKCTRTTNEKRDERWHRKRKEFKVRKGRKHPELKQPADRCKKAPQWEGDWGTSSGPSPDPIL